MKHPLKTCPYQALDNLQEHGSSTKDSNQGTGSHLHGAGTAGGDWWWGIGGVVCWWSNIGWGWSSIGWSLWDNGWWARSGGGGAASQSAGAWAVGHCDVGCLAHNVGGATLVEGGWVWAICGIFGDHSGGGRDGGVRVTISIVSHDGGDGSRGSENGGELHFDCWVWYLYG